MENGFSGLFGHTLELKIDEENKNKTIHLVNGCPKTLM